MIAYPYDDHDSLYKDDGGTTIIKQKPGRPSTVYHHPNRPPVMNRAMRRKLDALERAEAKKLFHVKQSGA